MGVPAHTSQISLDRITVIVNGDSIFSGEHFENRGKIRTGEVGHEDMGHRSVSGVGVVCG